MREVNLAGVQYPITGSIDQRRINPFKARLGAPGSLEYQDFQNASLEEYHDFRNGIGRDRGVGSEARLQFSEGIDFTIEGQTVLGGLVTTAGSFGVAPVKIIDFENNTYAIGNAKISKWSGSAWDLEGLLIEDCEDLWVDTGNVDGNVTLASSSLKKVGTYSVQFAATGAQTGLIMYEDITSIDLSGYTEINLWFHSNSSFNAGDLQLVLDDSPGSASPLETIDFPAHTGSGVLTPIKLTLANPGSDTAIVSVGIKNTASIDTKTFWIDQIVADGYMASPIDAIVVTDQSDTYLVVSSAQVAMYYDGTTWKYLPSNCQGYLAFYDTKLRSIDTDGGLVYSSAANNIDGTWTSFNLTGHFGTVYDLFEGKLLADGTPVLYFCGTEGLFTIDTTNEKAYKQEVEYPPLTYSGHKGMYWNANVWVATGFGILKVTPSLATYVGPDQDDGLPSTYQGSIFDMVTVNNWLVYCVNGGTTDRSSILKRNASLGGNLQVYTCGWHKAADTSTTIGATNASDQSTLETLLNEIKTDYNTHIASTTYHIAADSTNAVSSANASNLATALTLVNEIKADYNAHRILSGVHLGTDPDNIVASDTATDLATAITLANEIKADYNIHILSAGGAIACLHHSPSSLYTNGRLWFGEGTSVKYMMFPDTTSNVKQISTYEYVNDSGYGKLPIFRKLAVIPKVALGVAAITKSCDADDYIEVFYGLNGATPTTSLGTFTDSPRATILTFGSGLGTEYYTIQFAIKLFRNGGNTTSPELESLLFYWYPAAARISAWSFAIEAIGEWADKRFTDFETIYNTNTLVAFYPSGDTTKSSYNVKLTQMPSREYWEEMGGREGMFQVRLEQIFEG